MNKKKRNLKIVANNSNNKNNEKKSFFDKSWLFPNKLSYKTLHSYLQYLDTNNTPRRMLQIKCLEEMFPQYFEDLSDNNAKLTSKEREFDAVIQLLMFAAFDNQALGRYGVAFEYFSALIYNFDFIEVDFAELLAPYLVTIAHLGLVEEFERLDTYYPKVNQLVIYRLAKLYAHFMNEEYEQMDDEIRAIDQINPDYLNAIIYPGLIESHISDEFDIDFKIASMSGTTFGMMDDEDEYEPKQLPNEHYQEFLNNLIVLMEYGLYPMVIIDYIRIRINEAIPSRIDQLFNQLIKLAIEEERASGKYLFRDLNQVQIEALKMAELTTLEAFEKVTKKEVLALKGIGPKTIEILVENGAVFKEDK